MIIESNYSCKRYLINYAPGVLSCIIDNNSFERLTAIMRRVAWYVSLFSKVRISLALAPCYSMLCRTADSLQTHFTGHMKLYRTLSSFIQKICKWQYEGSNKFLISKSEKELSANSNHRLQDTAWSECGLWLYFKAWEHIKDKYL